MTRAVDREEAVQAGQAPQHEHVLAGGEPPVGGGDDPHPVQHADRPGRARSR